MVEQSGDNDQSIYEFPHRQGAVGVEGRTASGVADATRKQDQLAAGNEPLLGDREDAEGDGFLGWRFGPISAGLLGLGVSQAWFRIATGWVLYDDVSTWIVLIGLVLIAAGGPALARRARPSPWGEGVTGTELAWVGAVALGGALGLIQLLATF